MYRGAMIPGLLLAGAYITYAVLCAVLKPSSAPALPKEARVYDRPDGSRGLRSLLVLTIIASTVSYFATQHYFRERSAAHTSELQSLMRISYAVFCLKKKNTRVHNNNS